MSRRILVHDVLIAGAGPTGLALALWLTKQGANVRIIDKDEGPGETSRAMAVQARTLELYRQMELAEAVIAEGKKNPALNLWVAGKRTAQLAIGEAGGNISPYPFVLFYPQDLHERQLLNRLASMGVTVERQTELVAFRDDGAKVRAQLRGVAGNEETCEARFLAGCDGARSTVRRELGIGFQGGTYKHVYYVADVELTGLAPAGELHVALEQGDFTVAFPYGSNGHRLIGTVQDDRADRAETLTFEDVRADSLVGLGATVETVNWFSTYRVHHRVADRFRLGNIFLLGDAAHVHSPVGGQGMNTGILDSINLAWKLAAVLKGQASGELLESYEVERQAFARKLVQTTDRMFALVTQNGAFADVVKLRVVPLIARVANKIDRIRELIFRLISQTSLSYRDGPLSVGEAGAVHGGDRLPWVRTSNSDNYASLSRIGWELHIYGAASEDIRRWCEEHDVSLRIFDWEAGHERAGLMRDAGYLLRPDTYVACVERRPAAISLSSYLESHGVRLKGAIHRPLRNGTLR